MSSYENGLDEDGLITEEEALAVVRDAIADARQRGIPEIAEELLPVYQLLAARVHELTVR